MPWQSDLFSLCHLTKHFFSQLKTIYNMKTQNNVNQMLTPLWSRISGLAENTYYKCTTGTRLTIRNLSHAMVFTAFVSAFSITASVLFFFHSDDWVLSSIIGFGTFSIWFLFIILFDKSVIASSNYGILSFVRLVMVIAFSFIHAYVGSEFIFSKDIENQMIIRKHVDMRMPNEDLQKQVTQINADIKTQQNKLDNYKDKLTIAQNKYSEANNARYATAKKKYDVLSYEKQVLADQKQNFVKDTAFVGELIRKYNTQLNALYAAHTKLSDEKDIKNFGFLFYLTSLHEIIFEGKDNWLAFVWLAFFLIACAIEGLALFFKWGNSLAEYYDLEALDIKNNLEIKHFEANLDVSQRKQNIAREKKSKKNDVNDETKDIQIDNDDLLLS